MSRYIRVFVSSLRKKIEEDPARPRYLLTEQGMGYRLEIEQDQGKYALLSRTIHGNHC